MSKKPRRRRPSAPRPAPALMLSSNLSRWLVTAVAYLPTLANGFVNFDDIENFVNNRAYRGLGWTQDPRNAGAHNNLGVMLVSLGRYDDAALQFREALAISPGLREAQVNLEDATARARRKGATTR